MEKLIAVEQGLNNVSQALQSAGYQVVNLEQRNLQNVQCVIVSGGDPNLMGIQTTMTKAPVINAKGLSPEQVIEDVQKYQ